MSFDTKQYALTSESVTEGHPDKVCDFIADSILDAYLAIDPKSRVACEVLCKGDTVVLAGEITSQASVDHKAIVREAIRSIGYTDATEAFHADGVKIVELITRQSPEISFGVDEATSASGEQGAGDQGMMFGYATNETLELMPLPALLAHRLAQGLAEDRKSGRVAWLKPDGKTQVSVVYDGIVPAEVSQLVVSAQHSIEADQEMVREYVLSDLAPRALGPWFRGVIPILVNPTGSFVNGGPAIDCGVTGRKIIVDTYGGACPHGGGAFSGKDPSKVDRSGAYFARFVARQIVAQGLARRAIVQVAYAIGMAKPVSVRVDTMGTGNDCAAAAFAATLDFRPAAIIEKLGLLRPLYRMATNYGHFGRKGLPWEE